MSFSDGSNKIELLTRGSRVSAIGANCNPGVTGFELKYSSSSVESLERWLTITFDDGTQKSVKLICETRQH